MIPLIFDIRRYSINDGPGIRITIFMKGCTLKCKWCHNPESQSPDVQKLYTASKCIGAQECIEECPEDALTLTPDGIVTDFDACTLCGKCAEVCPTKAIEMSGELYSTEKLLTIIEKERVHIDQSGGGVTFSGGEPLMYPEFLIKMLQECGKKGLHRVVDTSGFAKIETLFEVAKHTDLFLFDLKLMNPEKHKQWTGVSNQLILKNLRILAENGAKINIRIPLIKNVNMDEKEIREMAEFILKLPNKISESEFADPKIPLVNLLPYHNIASGKYKKLEIPYDEGEMAEPSEDEINDTIEIFHSFGIETEVGG